MFAAFPPSSNVIFLSVPAIAFWIIFPTPVEPVKAILSIPEWFTISAPVSPAPVTIFTTPAGNPASSIISASKRVVSEVVSAGFNTTVFPQANAGAIFQAAINNGKFQGVICPATPNDLGFLFGKA